MLLKPLVSSSSRIMGEVRAFAFEDLADVSKRSKLSARSKGAVSHPINKDGDGPGTRARRVYTITRDAVRRDELIVTRFASPVSEVLKAAHI